MALSARRIHRAMGALPSCRRSPWRFESSKQLDGDAGELDVEDEEEMGPLRLHQAEDKQKLEMVNVVEKMAAQYRIKKQRVHAMLWQQEEDLAMSSTDKPGPSSDGFYDKYYATYPRTEGQSSEIDVAPNGWEGKSNDHSLAQQGESEQKLLVQEFERRMDFNKRQLYAFVKQHIMSRRRPIDGWSYMVEELGLESKRGRVNGIRTAEPSSNKSPVATVARRKV